MKAILDATAHILATEGYAGLNTNLVARAAGVSIGSLYQYFPSKEALVNALIDDHLRSMTEVLMQHVQSATDSIAKDVRNYVEAMLAAHRVDPELHRVLVEQAPRLAQASTLSQLHTMNIAMVQSYLEGRKGALRKRELSVPAYLIYRAIEGTIHACLRERRDLLESGQLVDELTDLIVRYLVP